MWRLVKCYYVLLWITYYVCKPVCNNTVWSIHACWEGLWGLCRATTSSAKMLAWPAVQFRMFKGVQFVARLLNSMVGYVYIFFKIILKAHVVRSKSRQPKSASWPAVMSIFYFFSFTISKSRSVYSTKQLSRFFSRSSDLANVWIISTLCKLIAFILWLIDKICV